VETPSLNAELQLIVFVISAFSLNILRVVVFSVEKLPEFVLSVLLPKKKYERFSTSPLKIGMKIKTATAFTLVTVYVL
jgi:hypothetical protein